MSSTSAHHQRLFLGFSLSDEQTAALHTWQQQYLSASVISGSNVKAVQPNNLHLTLAFLGNVNSEQLLPLHESVEALPLERFSQPLSQLDYWPTPKICCLTQAMVTPALQHLADAAQKLAGRLQLHQSEHAQYRPHISLARKLSQTDAAQVLQQTAPQLCLAPQQLHLYESSNAGSGVRYEIVASWPLET